MCKTRMTIGLCKFRSHLTLDLHTLDRGNVSILGQLLGLGFKQLGAHERKQVLNAIVFAHQGSGQAQLAASMHQGNTLSENTRRCPTPPRVSGWVKKKQQDLHVNLVQYQQTPFEFGDRFHGGARLLGPFDLTVRHPTRHHGITRDHDLRHQCAEFGLVFGRHHANAVG